MRITVHVIQVHCRLQFVWLTTIQKRARNSLTQPKEEEEEAEREKKAQTYNDFSSEYETLMQEHHTPNRSAEIIMAHHRSMPR